MKTIDLLIVEAGHGILNGKDDPGACGTKTTERDLNIRYANTVSGMMQGKAGLVQEVGGADATLIAKEAYIKSVIATKNQDNVYGICIHQNGFSDPSANGFEVWYQSANPKAKDLANEIVAAYKEYFPSNHVRGVFPSNQDRLGRLYIDDFKGTFVLTEGGFVTNPTDQDFLLNNVDRLSEAICHGLMTFIRK